MQNPVAGRIGQSYAVNAGTVSATSANDIAFGVKMVRLVATPQPAWIEISNTPTAVANTSVYLPANVPEYFLCGGSGKEQVAAITAAGTVTSTVYVTEMTR